jgi:hypothetical protein
MGNNSIAVIRTLVVMCDRVSTLIINMFTVKIISLKTTVMNTLKTFIYVLLLILISLSCQTVKKKTIVIKEGFVGMIGYGSLMSLKTFEQTLGHKYLDSIYQVHLNNYVREWSYFWPIDDPKFTSPEGAKYDAFFIQENDTIPFEGFVNLTISQKEKSKINCVLYLITQIEMLKFDKMEEGYQKLDVTDKIEEYSFKGGQVYAYEHVPDPQLKVDKTKYIVLKDDVDHITDACDSIGMDFRKEFDNSTVPYSGQIIPQKKIFAKRRK